MRVALFGRTPKEEDIIYVQKLIDRIEQVNNKLFIHERFYNKIKSKVRITKDIECFNTKEELKIGADILISLGGDGTFLETLPIVMDSEIPIIGINLGHLGFLTSVGRDGVDILFDELNQENFTIENHSLIKLFDNSNKLETNYALNDIYLKASKIENLLDINIYVDNEFLATYTADGVIITTPTGSTAYNMSAGGPIISPKSSCLGITPICPHNLTLRPIIIPDNSIICLEIPDSNKEVSLYMDSFSRILKPPFKISISKADFDIKLIRMQGESFFTAIRNKLMWGANIRRK